jgi:hypothetical protein
MVDWLEQRRKGVFRFCIGVLVLLVALDAIPVVVDKEHAHTWAEHLPGFWSVFGLAGCVILVVVSKFYGHRGIMTREDYYDE